MRTVGGQLCIAAHSKNAEPVQWQDRVCSKYGPVEFLDHMDQPGWPVPGTKTRLAQGSSNRYLGEFSPQSCLQREYIHPFLRSPRYLATDLRSPNPTHI